MPKGHGVWGCRAPQGYSQGGRAAGWGWAGVENSYRKTRQKLKSHRSSASYLPTVLGQGSEEGLDTGAPHSKLQMDQQLD